MNPLEVSLRATQCQYTDVLSKVHLYLKVSRFDLARNVLNVATSEYPGDGRLYNLLGLVYHKESNFSEAIRNFKISQEKQTDLLEATLNLIVTLCDVGLYDSASSIFQSHQTQSLGGLEAPSPGIGHIAELHCELGNRYATMGFHSEAANQFELAFKLTHGNPAIGYKLASMYIECGRMESAQILLQNIIKAAETDVQALNLLGLAFFCNKQIGKAKEYWGLSHKIDPSDKISANYLCIVAEN